MLAGWKHRPTILICAGLFAITLAVFWPVTRSEFISYDDPYYILNNQMVQRGVTGETAQWAFTTRHASNWHPITWLSHMLDVRLFGLNAGGHHLTNLLLHGTNAALVFLLLQLLTGAVWRSAVVAGLFALHPLHVESVAWISERKDVLCAFFGLLCLIAYAKYARAKSECEVRSAEQPATPHPALSPIEAERVKFVSWWYGLALFCFALGLMSKPMLVTWPCLMLLLDFWPLGRVAKMENGRWKMDAGRWRPLVIEKLPFLVLTMVSCVMTLWAQQKAVAGTDALPTWARLGNSALAYAKYLFKTVWPADLIVHYPMAEKLSLLMVAGALILVGGITAWIWWQRGRRPYLLTGWCWFLGTLVPVIGLVQVGAQAMGDRYTYLPLIGVFVMVVWGLAELISVRAWPKDLAAGAAVTAVIGCAFLARNQLEHWRTSVTLFEHALAVAPNNFIALDNLGYSYLEKNEPLRAEAVLKRALEILPNNPGTHSSMGRALLMQGRAEEAVTHFEQALKSAPGKPAAIYDLGLGLAAAGRLDEAIARFNEALKLAPEDRRPYRDLAMALDEKGDSTAALASVSQYLQAVTRDPAARLHQACLLDETGQTDAARAAANQALALQPALLDQLYASAPQLAAAGKLKLAEQCYRSLVLLQPAAAAPHLLYGQFLLTQGKSERGLGHLREAVQLQPDAQGHYIAGVAEIAYGNIQAGLNQLREALRLQPDWPLALNELAWLLATHPDAAVRDGIEAVKLAERACELTEYKEARFVGTLDASYAEAGRFSDATKTATRTQALATAAGLVDVADAATKRAELYRASKPYRLPPLPTR